MSPIFISYWRADAGGQAHVAVANSHPAVHHLSNPKFCPIKKRGQLDVPAADRAPGPRHCTEVREEMKHMKQLSSAYLRRFYYDTIAHNDELMMNVVRQVGVDRIVMGSDYCFQISDDHPVATVNRLSKSISVAEREMILGKTAARLLKL